MKLEGRAAKIVAGEITRRIVAIAVLIGALTFVGMASNDLVRRSDVIFRGQLEMEKPSAASVTEIQELTGTTNQVEGAGLTYESINICRALPTLEKFSSSDCLEKLEVAKNLEHCKSEKSNIIDCWSKEAAKYNQAYVADDSCRATAYANRAIASIGKRLSVDCRFRLYTLDRNYIEKSDVYLQKPIKGLHMWEPEIIYTGSKYYEDVPISYRLRELQAPLFWLFAAGLLGVLGVVLLGSEISIRRMIPITKWARNLALVGGAITSAVVVLPDWRRLTTWYAPDMLIFVAICFAPAILATAILAILRHSAALETEEELTV